MRKTLLFLITLFFSFSLYGDPLVLVSVAPQKYLVHRIAKNTVSVEVIVPSAASPHSFEPTPHQIVKIMQAQIWFRIGEGFEKPLLSVFKKMEIVDQRDGIDLIPAGCKSCCKDACDSHIWLSPRNLKIMAAQIADVLSKKYPEHASAYQENLAAFIAELNALDKDIAQTFSKEGCKTVLVSHPAFGYFARDYGLRQISIEMEGKEPTAKHLTELYQIAHKEKIDRVFLQKQYNYKAGKRLARLLKARIQFIDPYAEDVVENLKIIAKAFSCS